MYKTEHGYMYLYLQIRKWRQRWMPRAGWPTSQKSEVPIQHSAERPYLKTIRWRSVKKKYALLWPLCAHRCAYPHNPDKTVSKKMSQHLKITGCTPMAFTSWASEVSVSGALEFGHISSCFVRNRFSTETFGFYIQNLMIVFPIQQ